MEQKKIKIYIIEDYFLTRISYVKHFSSEENFELLGDFGTAEECLSAMEKEPADVVMIDLGLPTMNGIQATKYLKEKYPNTKSIILTSHENENEIMASIACGARGYILKEMPLEKITEIVKAVNIGAYFFDEKIEHIPLGTIPTPKSTNFDDLYDTPELKNRLTDRELEVLGLLVKGRTNPEIAKELFVSANTVKAHVGSIITKLDVSDRVQAVVKALQLRLIK